VTELEKRDEQTRLLEELKNAIGSSLKLDAAARLLGFLGLIVDTPHGRAGWINK
jgi:hypothetical protein